MYLISYILWRRTWIVSPLIDTGAQCPHLCTERFMLDDPRGLSRLKFKWCFNQGSDQGEVTSEPELLCSCPIGLRLHLCIQTTKSSLHSLKDICSWRHLPVLSTSDCLAQAFHFVDKGNKIVFYWNINVSVKKLTFCFFSNNCATQVLQ